MTKTRRNAPDKELIRERTLDVLAYYLNAPGKDQGSRVVWDCPSCNKTEKFAVKKAERKGGCLVTGCRLEGYGDVFSLVARFEDLDCRAEFLQVLEKAYDALGLDPDAQNNGKRKEQKRYSGGEGASRHGPGPTRTVSRERRAHGRSRAEVTASGETGTEAARGCDQAEIREISGRAYERILELCPLESRDRRYLRTRGLSYETITRGRFGTMTVARAREVKAVLQRELGCEALLSVPGFSEDEETGRLKFTLSGDYLLIPYHDAEGHVTTIEGRTAGKVPQGMGKYVSLRGAGNHLYVFPGHKPGDLLAVCEGVMGAVAAAEAGLAVGSIQGCERYRASASPDFPDGEPGDPLLELKGTDFGQRLLPYVPDADSPPNPRVLRAAPKAARWLAEPHNATPAICLLPDGRDLDEWLLYLRPDERRRRFEELLENANPPEGAHATSGGASATKSTSASTGVTAKGPATVKERSGDRPKPSVETPSEHPEDRSSAAPGADRDRPTRRASRGARRLRDEVYRALLESLPPKESHLEALSRRGVMRETARVGRLGSLNGERAGSVVGGLVRRFGAKRLLSVPGFERAGSGSVRLAALEECLLLPCFDGEGLVSAVEALPVDRETGDVSGEDTVPLPGAGDHLYVFAAYLPEEVEGFCEGPLGALLAAQEDVVVGAIGGFRRHGWDSRRIQGGEVGAAALPELDGVDFSGREVSYVPRVGSGEENARYHEAESAARRLIEDRGGRPRIACLGDAEREHGPTSLAEWILSLEEDETEKRLREIFPESPRRRTREDAGQDDEPVGRGRHEGQWLMHETPRKRPPSEVPVTLPEAVLGALAWPIVYAASGWSLETTERLLALAADLGMVPQAGTPVANPILVSAMVATLASAFVLWRRRAMRIGEARMLAGRIEH